MMVAMNSTFSAEGPVQGLVAWLDKPARSSLRHALVIGSRCGADLDSLGTKVAAELNTLAERDQRHWRSFCINELRHLAGDPARRETILGTLPPDLHPGPPDSDLDRIARRLARIGGAVLEGQYALDATAGLANTFRVCLCSSCHECPESCNLLLNPEDHPSRQSLADAIVAAFLQWEPAHPISANFQRAV